MFGKFRTAGAGLPGIALFRGVIPTVASLAFIVYISYLGWMSLGPEKPVPDEKRQAIAVKSIEKISERLRGGRGELNSAVLLHFSNDASGFVTDTLRNALNSSGIITLEDRSFSEKLKNKLNIVNKGFSSRAAALKAARDLKAEGLIWGTVARFESFPGGALIKGTWELVNVKTGAVIISGVMDEDSSRKLPAAAPEKKKAAVRSFADPLGTLPLMLRIAGFLLCMLMVPLVSFAFIRTLIARNSNQVNAVMLSLLMLIDLIFAYFMVGGAFAEPSGVFLFLGAGVCGFLYNVSMLRFARKLES